MRLAGKTAIITGASRGIGRAAALLFLEEGANVVAAANEDAIFDLARTTEPGGLGASRAHTPAEGPAGPVRAVENLARTTAEPARLVTLCVDVTSDEEVRRMVENAEQRFGRLDILFNNAGAEVPGAITDMEPSEWDRQLDVNLRSVYLCCRHAVPAMLRHRRGGSIVNNASINAIRGNTALVAYCASKGGVAALTRAMAIDYAAKGIRVNCICPGTIDDTEMVQRKLRLQGDPLRAALIAKHPMGRLGTAREVAYAALFLASDESSFITGVELAVDGGRAIR